MAQDLNTVVNDFLRDAQYRIAELSVVIDNGKRNSKRRGNRNQTEKDLRMQLWLWMECLYDSSQSIYGTDYNFLYDWTDREIIEECEYLRALAQMNEIPYLSFTGHTSEVRTVVTQTTTGNLPVGSEDDIITYDGNGTPISIPFPAVGGMQSETIEQYFS